MPRYSVEVEPYIMSVYNYVVEADNEEDAKDEGIQRAYDEYSLENSIEFYTTATLVDEEDDADDER